MGKTYKASEDDDIRPTDVELRKRLSARRPRDRWDDEFRQHMAAQTRDKRSALSVNGYREEE
jgi:hypothetical protein